MRLGVGRSEGEVFVTLHGGSTPEDYQARGDQARFFRTFAPK